MNKKINRNIEQPGKVISKSFTELLDAFKKDGCPICNLNYSNINSYFSGILYESVNDPEVRKKLRNSFGYCRDHSIQFIKFVESSYNRFGASIMISDVTVEIIKKLESLSKLSLKELKRINITKHACPACTYQRSFEDIYYSEIISNLENKDFFNKLLGSEGLCLTHMLALIKITKDPYIRDEIIQNQKSKLFLLIKDMDAFVAKHSEQASGKITSDEAEAFKKAIRKIIGQ